MSRKLYVANIPFRAIESDVEEMFKEFGTINEIKFIYGEGGRHRGFGFIEMDSEESAKNAIEELNGAELMGRNLIVDIAKERAERRDREREYDRRGYGNRY